MIRTILPACALLSVILTSLARAEQSLRFDDLQVHYNVFNSTSISEEMATRYSLKRGENIALVNIAGRRELADGSNSPVPLKLDGTVSNLLGQTRPLAFRSIMEPGALYYILTTRFSDQETLRFRLTVTDLETGRSYPLQFQKELWKQ